MPLGADCCCGSFIILLTSYCYREPTPHYLGVVKTLLMALVCLCPPLWIHDSDDEGLLLVKERLFCHMDDERAVLMLQRDWSVEPGRRMRINAECRGPAGDECWQCVMQHRVL